MYVQIKLDSGNFLASCNTTLTHLLSKGTALIISNTKYYIVECVLHLGGVTSEYVEVIVTENFTPTLQLTPDL